LHYKIVLCGELILPVIGFLTKYTSVSRTILSSPLYLIDSLRPCVFDFENLSVLFSFDATYFKISLKSASNEENRRSCVLVSVVVKMNSLMARTVPYKFASCNMDGAFRNFWLGSFSESEIESLVNPRREFHFLLLSKHSKQRTITVDFKLKLADEASASW